METFKNFILEFKTPIFDENFHSDMEFDPEVPLYVQKMKDMSLLKIPWMNVDCNHLRQFSNSLCQHLIIYPQEVIPAMDSVVDTLYKTYDHNTTDNIQIRPFNCEQSRQLRNLNPEDLDQLVTVNGLVIRVSNVISEMRRAHFKCSICHFATKVLCEKGRFVQPENCLNCHANHTQEILHNLSDYVDKQIVKLQVSVLFDYPIFEFLFSPIFIG